MTTIKVSGDGLVNALEKLGPDFEVKVTQAAVDKLFASYIKSIQNSTLLMSKMDKHFQNVLQKEGYAASWKQGVLESIHVSPEKLDHLFESVCNHIVLKLNNKFLEEEKKEFRNILEQCQNVANDSINSRYKVVAKYQEIVEQKTEEALSQINLAALVEEKVNQSLPKVLESLTTKALREAMYNTLKAEFE